MEASAWALERDDAVVCLPTGTGKTLVGCMWACDLLDKRSIDRILVLEPSRFLVEQVYEYICEQTTIDAEKLYGNTKPEIRRGQWNRGDVVVTTPQTALNDIDFLDFDAVLIDECHHTTGQHAFVELVLEYQFKRKLGLSATIPRKKEREITIRIGDIRRWIWQDLPSEHVPDWFGEVYDTPVPDSYRAVIDRLEEYRLKFDNTVLAGLPTLGIRMLCRDGALALSETLTSETRMGELMRDDLLPVLQDCPDLHKLRDCRAALAHHDFEKAVLFVDRVTIARRLATELSDYQLTTVLGRLHAGTDGQQDALRMARRDETKLIIATAAGEEGMDLPNADLLIVWSNTVNSVRFIQRLGRVMRKTNRDQPKAAVYLATPDSPDYESLHRGIARAADAGLDIVGLDEDAIMSKSIVTRVTDTLDGNPLKIDDLCETLNQPERTVDRWLRKNVREGELFYLYAVPRDLNDWRTAAKGIANYLDIDLDADDLRQPTGKQFIDEVHNNLSPSKQNRYYARCDDIDLLRTDIPSLFDDTPSNQLSVQYGPSYQDRTKYSTRGDVVEVRTDMQSTLADESNFYANISHQSHSPTFFFQVLYNARATPAVLDAVVENANAVATTVQDRLR